MKSPKIELPLRTLLVDDEYRSRSSLRILLGHHFPNVVVVGEAETVAEGVQLLQSLRPDLVFLDVMLPDGSGFDFLELVKHLSTKVVIVSAFAEYSLRAFQYEAVHYLLKPFDLRDLQAAVARVAAGMQEAPRSDTSPLQGDRLALTTLEGFRLVTLDEIVYAEADGNYTTFHFADRSTFVVSNPVGYYEELLADKSFCRVHHAHLVNLRHIKAYHRGRGGWIELSNEKSVEVSVRKRDAFLARLGEYAWGIS